MHASIQHECSRAHACVHVHCMHVRVRYFDIHGSVGGCVVLSYNNNCDLSCCSCVAVLAHSHSLKL